MEKSIIKYRFALGVTLLLALSAMFSTYTVRDVLTMQEATGFSLDMGLFYIICAPVFNILDLMTALSISQHIAWLFFLFSTLYVALLYLFRLKDRWVRWSIAFVVSIAIIIALYTMAILMPRPMASLVIPDSNMLVVDFHSHTDASHDANKSFTAEDNRWWHEQAGFDAAFVTDHSVFEGAIAGKLRNVATAQDGLQLMDGVEVRHMGGHVLALCATSVIKLDKKYTWPMNKYGCQPLLVQANPGPIEESDERFRERDIKALEVHDGAPIALEDVRSRKVWIAKARSLNIAIVSGSDNHGWAYAAGGWSILRIKDWKRMGADELALAITKSIRSRGFEAVQVVERHMILPAETIVAHITMPIRLIWRMWRQLSLEERLSWLVWAWLISFVWVKVRHDAI